MNQLEAEKRREGADLDYSFVMAFTIVEVS